MGGIKTLRCPECEGQATNNDGATQRTVANLIEHYKRCHSAPRIRELEDCVVEQRLTIVKGDAHIRELEATIERVRAVLDAAGGEVLTCEVADAMDPTTEGD